MTHRFVRPQWWLSCGLAVVLLGPACDAGGMEVATGNPVDLVGSCPVTVQEQPGFAPPAPYAPKPSDPDAVWYGTGDLWTVLEAQGARAPRKSVWWSAHYQGGLVEPAPDISVVYDRLDRASPLVTGGGPGTNAHTVHDGWFMIAGIDPTISGCWRVTASYRGATLSYVYQMP